MINPVNVARQGGAAGRRIHSPKQLSSTRLQFIFEARQRCDLQRDSARSETAGRTVAQELGYVVAHSVVDAQ